MMKKFQLLVFLSFITLAAAAQNDFLLYSFKGNVSVVENNLESKAKIGKTIKSNATLKLAAGSSVTMICNEAAMFTITKAGTYPLSKFGDSCKVSTNSVTANYAKYVWASMTKSSGTAASNRKAYMNTVGAVSRNVNSIFFEPRLGLDSVNYAGNGGSFPFSWVCYSESKEFEFYLFSSDNLSEPIHVAKINKKKIPIADFASKMKPGSTYYWTVAVKGEENETLNMLNYVTKESFETLLAGIKSQGVVTEAPAEQAYRIAFMLEDAKYLADAYQYYLKAATLDPNNVLYRSTLMSFKKDYEIK